jgi:uncharacterized membrane protein YccC
MTRPRVPSWLSSLWKSRWLTHSARTAVAAVSSLAIARVFRMPEAYWAAVTTLVVMQSTLGAAWDTSKKRLVGTALGAGLGALVATVTAVGLVLFGAGIFVLGLICALLRTDLTSYRFAGITFAIVTLITRIEPADVVAAHRFIEVSIGIAVALALTWVWRGQDPITRRVQAPSPSSPRSLDS